MSPFAIMIDRSDRQSNMGMMLPKAVGIQSYSRRRKGNHSKRAIILNLLPTLDRRFRKSRYLRKVDLVAYDHGSFQTSASALGNYSAVETKLSDPVRRVETCNLRAAFCFRENTLTVVVFLIEFPKLFALTSATKREKLKLK